MTQLSKPLEAALAEVAALAPDQQNLIALEITQHVRALTGQPTKLTPEERAELEAELAAARRGNSPVMLTWRPCSRSTDCEGSLPSDEPAHEVVVLRVRHTSRDPAHHLD
jgi:hypothetical protein